MIMFKIRTASKNFLCEKCNTLIPNGPEYFDSWDYNNTWHKRFHKECVCDTRTEPTQLKSSNSVTENKPNIFDRVQKLIEREKGSLIIAKDGIKYYICGIVYNENNEKVFLCETWGDKKPFFETADNMKKYIDCNGNYF